MEPTTAILAGSLLGAGGNIAGGLLADSTVPASNQTFVSNNPFSNPLLAALGFDAATGLGFADASSLASPLQDISNQIQQLPISEKSKRRALAGLPRALAAISDDPSISLRDAVSGVLGANESAVHKSLVNVLARVGLGDREIRDLAVRQSRFRDQQQQLSDSGLSGLQLDTILERAEMARQLQRLQSSAAEYAVSGRPSGLQQQFADRRTRALDAAEEQAFLRAANTGQRPGTLERDFADLRAGNDLAALSDLIQTTGALQQVFSGQRAPAESTTRIGLQAQSNALNTAASQAQAANNMLAQGQAAQGAALGSGIAAGIGGIGSAIGNIGQLGLLNQYGALGSPATETRYQPDQSLYASNYQFNPNLPAYGYINTGG